MSEELAEAAAARYDEREHTAAARIGKRNPHWLIIWGTYSRLFWAFPLFDVPPGTIISAPSPTELLTRMREAELASAQSPPTR
jgi:hypothetical protein